MSGDGATLSEYEQLRLKHMKRNHEYLVSLGLKKASDPIAPNHVPEKRKRTTTEPRRKKALIDPALCRRSSRLAGKEAAPVDEEALSDGEEEDEAEKENRRGRNDRNRESINAATMAFLREVREASLPVVHSDDWQKEATRRWGSACRARSDWKTFVVSRLSTPPPPSPLDFLQEYYAADSWRLLVSCVLMSRVSSWTTKHNCISNFFEKYQTPTAFFEETEFTTVRSLINPLGLFDDRLKSLVALTTTFLQGPDEKQDDISDAFQLSTERNHPYKIHGIGPFGLESFLVFCRDQGPTISLSTGGKPLEPFVKWRKAYIQHTPI